MKKILGILTLLAPIALLAQVNNNGNTLQARLDSVIAQLQAARENCPGIDNALDAIREIRTHLSEQAS